MIRFLDSETKLNEIVKQISNITLAELPLYNDFIRLSGDSLSQIITHPNGDIINQFIIVFNDLIDHEYEQDQSILLQFIKSQNILNFLLEYLKILIDQDDEDSKDVQITILTIFNELTNYEDDELRKQLIEFDQLTQFFNDSVRQISTVEGISYYDELVTDYLFKIVDWDKLRFVAKHDSAIEIFLIQLSHFTETQPEEGSTQENFIESIISILSMVLTSKDGRSKFLQLEGFELLLILIKNGDWGFKTFVKLSNYLIESINDTNNVELSVSIIESNFFLNNVFKILKQNHKDRDEIYQILKILVKLIIFLPFNSDQRIRLINKLVNKNFKSLNVLLKIESKYDQNVSKLDVNSEQTYSFDDQYLEKIENGLDILQQISIFKSWLLIEDEKLKNDMIHMKHFNLEKLKNILNGYKDELKFNIENTEDDVTKNEFFEYISMINELLANLYT
ncbi:unnamed protein product [Wickerhamomyces anomalus]